MHLNVTRLFLFLLPVVLLGLSSCGREEPAVAPVIVPIPGEVKMNEIYSRGTPGNLDWIELYNTGETTLDISGYLIYDAGGQGGTKPKKAIPAGTVIAPKSYFVVTTDTNTSAAVLDGFGLSSGGEQAWLENATGAVIDAVTFPAMDVTQTYGRYPDGDTTWALLNTITKGTANKQ
ncbi:MAG: hypothetical protein H6Q31_540 [Bacteroidetes bacterium]|nr:hypothetical protein [Bacteroidota bacterium]